MKAVILAAGLGSRLWKLTQNRIPKHLVKLNGKPLLSYIIANLPEEISEIILVVGNKGDKIKQYLGRNFAGRKISYVEQKDLRGTAAALFLCKDLLRGDRFLVLNGDDIYGRQDIARCLRHQLCLLVKEVPDPRRFGVIKFKKNQQTLEDIVENPSNPPSNFVNTGLFVMDSRIFDYPLVPKSKNSKEFGLPQTFVQMAKDYPVYVEKAKIWLPVNRQEELKEAERRLRARNEK